MSRISLSKKILSPLKEVKIPKQSTYPQAKNVMKVETDTLNLYSKNQKALNRFQKTIQ